MQSNSLEILFSLETIQDAARSILIWAEPARILTFSGSLGAGKTTLIRAICAELRVQDAVSSPTFALINDYVFDGIPRMEHILHMDWYRLKDEDEALNAGMEDALESDARFCFVEWPEKARGLLNLPHVAVQLLQEGNGDRRLIATHCDRYEPQELS